MTKEEFEDRKKKFKESDAYKWYRSLTDNDKLKLDKSVVLIEGNSIWINGHLAITRKGIVSLYIKHKEDIK